MMDQLNFWWNRDDELTQERNLASQGFPVAADRLKESRRIIGLPRAPTIEMHPPMKKTAGSGTGAAPPKKEEKPSTPRAWGAIDLDHYTSKRDASRKGRAPGNAGTPRASSAGGRAPAVPARQLVISPRLHEPEEPPPARLKERAKLNPNPQAASKERARVLARSTPAARAAIRTKQASSGEQGSEDDPEDSQEDEQEKEATGAQEGELEVPEEPEELGPGSPKEEEPEELGEEKSSEEMQSSGNHGEGEEEEPPGTPQTPKSGDEDIEPDHLGGQAGMTDGGEATEGQGAATDGGGSAGPKRRGNRGGKKHKKRQSGSTSDAGWYNIGSGHGSGSDGSRGSWKSWKGYGGYMAASKKARGGWR